MRTTIALFITAILTIITPCFGTSGPSRGEVVQSKTFDVNKGGTLEVSISVGDIIVGAWQKNQVSVQATGIDPDEIERMSMEQVGNTVRVTFHPQWGGGTRIRFQINVPSEFNTNLHTSGGDIQLQGGFKGKLDGSTSGGDIKLSDVDGQVEMSTSGGDIIAGTLNGTCTLHTSGGDIHVQTSGGQVELVTSGGDISIGNVGKSLTARTSGGDISIGDVGGELNAGTAGGDIQVGKVSGNASLKTAGGNIELKGGNGTIKAKTAGGDVSLQNISGSVEASTAGGDVDADLRPSGSGRSRLSSSGGDVTLYLPDNAKATIDALIDVRGHWKSMSSEYEIVSDFKAKTFEKDEDAREIHAVYVLNGGGEDISLETVNGNIYVRSARNKQ
jgi:DUF4097 and DUF4098 domain-containing protein YvlB